MKRLSSALPTSDAFRAAHLAMLDTVREMFGGGGAIGYLLLAVLMVPSAVQAETAADFMSEVPACLANAADSGSLTCLGDARNICEAKIEGGYSTFGMSQCAQAETDAWNILMNHELQAALAFAKDINASDVTSPSNAEDAVRASQKTWEQFRDAQCQMEYAKWGGGTMRVTAGGDCLLQTTAERALFLHNWRQVEP